MEGFKFRPFFAEINLDNLRENYRNILKSVKEKEVIGVIKANGYGHGAVEVARVLEEEGVDILSVAILQEAMELREGGSKLPILVLGYTPIEFVPEIVKYDITQIVYTYELAEAISREALKEGKIAKIHIGLDTGMSRIGFTFTEESLNDILRISKLGGIELEGIFSHFSSADEGDKEFSRKQIEVYRRMINRLKEDGIDFEIKHIANSAAVLDLPESYYDAIRPGIILYGYYPSNEVNKEKIQVKPVMTLKARVAHVKEVGENTPVSYGRKFITRRRTKIATLPFGYADGFTRRLFERAQIIVNGKLAPVIGVICMDQCMIDVTDCGDVKIGDEVIVMGESNGIINNADTYAELLETINYEILTTVGRRVPRVYIENGKIISVKNYL